LKGTALAQDIVCGMEIEEDDSKTVVKTFLHKTFFFCSAECMLIFTKDSSYFLSAMKNEATVVDLVCGMSVDTSRPLYFTEYKGMRFYFCCHACREQFEGNPRQFVGS